MTATEIKEEAGCQMRMTGNSRGQPCQEMSHSRSQEECPEGGSMKCNWAPRLPREVAPLEVAGHGLEARRRDFAPLYHSFELRGNLRFLENKHCEEQFGIP